MSPMSTYPCVTAYIVRADTLLMLSFSIKLRRCVMVVVRLMFKRSAISLLIKPFTISVITSISRADKCFSLLHAVTDGGRLRPSAWADCSRASNERTSCFSGTEVFRQWKPVKGEGEASCELFSTIVLRLCSVKKCKSAVIALVEAK